VIYCTPAPINKVSANDITLSDFSSDSATIESHIFHPCEWFTSESFIW
jgi:hypothetical protein